MQAFVIVEMVDKGSGNIIVACSRPPFVRGIVVHFDRESACFEQAADFIGGIRVVKVAVDFVGHIIPVEIVSGEIQIHLFPVPFIAF